MCSCHCANAGLEHARAFDEQHASSNMVGKLLGLSVAILALACLYLTASTLGGVLPRVASVYNGSADGHGRLRYGRTGKAEAAATIQTGRRTAYVAQATATAIFLEPGTL